MTKPLKKDYELNINLNDYEKFLEDIYEYQEKELKRRTLIEDKGKSLIFVITLSTTFLLSNLTFIYEYHDKFNPLLIIILIIGLIFLILSVLSIIHVVKIRPHHNLYLFDKYKIEHTTKKYLKNNNKIKKEINELKNDRKIIELLKSIELNECIILQKSNSLDCAFSLIERSIICIVFYFILLITNIYFTRIITSLLHLFNMIPK